MRTLQQRMERYYITMRLKQLWRFFSFNGFYPVAGILLTVGIFLAISVTWFEKAPYSEWTYAALAIFLIMELQSRPSNNFLKEHVDKGTYFRSKLAENSIALLPFIFMLLYKQAWLPATLLALSVVPYSLYNLKIPKPKLKAIRSPYKAYAIEWHNNFRSVFPIYLIHLLLLIPGVISHNFYVYLVPFFLLLFFMNTTYGVLEEKFLVWVYRTNATQFLFRKIKALAINYFVTVGLFLVVGVISYPAQTGVLLLCVIAGFICLLGSLFIKYHFYPGEFIIQLSQMIFLGVSIGSIINPSLMILTVLMLVFSFFRARNNLKSILQC